MTKMTDMTMTVGHVPGLAEGQMIDVRVEHDDGWVSIAEVPGVNFRCYVNTSERRAYWEIRDGAGEWHGIATGTVADLPQPLRESMHRAAAAGIVAAGLRL